MKCIRKRTFLMFAFVVGIASSKCAFGMDIWQAICENNVSVAREFLAGGKFDVDDCSTLLWKAIYHNSLGVVALLLEYCANVNDNCMNVAEKKDEIFDLLNLARLFDAEKDKKTFINMYENSELKNNKQEEIKFSAMGSFMLPARFKNSKEEREKALFGLRVPDLKNGTNLSDVRIKCIE